VTGGAPWQALRLLEWRGTHGATTREVAEFIREVRTGLTTRYA